MRTTHFPFRYPIGTHFPQLREVAGGEGWVAYTADQAGKYYLIVDEGTLADFLGPEDGDLLKQLITVHEFDTEIERRKALTDLNPPD